MQQWLYLTMAIGLEVCGTLSMKASQELTNARWAVAMAIFYLLSFACMAMALGRINVSTAYAIWSGLGTAIIAIVGILHYHEPYNLLKLLSLVLIVVGVVGLKLFDK